MAAGSFSLKMVMECPSMTSLPPSTLTSPLYWPWVESYYKQSKLNNNNTPYDQHLEHVHHVVQGDEGVVDGDHGGSLLQSGPEDQASNTTKSVDSNVRHAGCLVGKSENKIKVYISSKTSCCTESFQKQLHNLHICYSGPPSTTEPSSVSV